MTDAAFVIAAYGVVFAALGAYVATVWRRAARARAASLRIRRDAEGGAAGHLPHAEIAAAPPSDPRP